MVATGVAALCTARGARGDGARVDALLGPAIKPHHPGVIEPGHLDARHAHILVLDRYATRAGELDCTRRVDLAFAPLPAAADPILLQWFGQNHAPDWVGEGGVSEALLSPSLMHSLLELSRMQKAHELLLTEAEIYGLSPLPQLYDARDNEMGCTCDSGTRPCLVRLSLAVHQPSGSL